MKQILKTIGFGIVLGATAFFIPFIFKFIFAVFLVGLIFKMISKGRKRSYIDGSFESYGNYYSPIVSIDNQWYKPEVKGNGFVQNINVNY
ncbi:hypothetical protein [Pedobacter mendelii]|uniref:Uncharacterized protein n=1 Tax=Pedobacter mendelii TaxID=1908240 RepID=A0ABQ2BK97_9SPHI|nr:hypothetical protein [Pedobacter mendelii]GGI26654.1 hypothetical protein GCM10008119_23730 [Pedobacter mendelii]